MIEKLRRKKRWCTAVCIVGAIPLMMLAVGDTAPGLQVVSGFLVLGIGFAGHMAAGRIDSKIRQAMDEDNRQKPLLTVSATVVSYRVGYQHRSSGRHGVRSTPYWYVTFRTSRYGDVELQVSHDVYMACPKNRQGTLTYQGWQFISFK